MKLALVTTPPSVRSGIGDYTRHLLPYLREHADIEIYVEDGLEDPLWDQERPHLARDLDPRRYDQVLYQLGNERTHAFMARMIRAVGGTVMQHDWVLFDLALATYPALVRGDAKGHFLALREGGLEQARRYRRNWSDRRAQRMTPVTDAVQADLKGTLLTGWHGAEPKGRWTTDQATLRLPASGVTEVAFDLIVERGRQVRVLEGGEALGDARGDELRVRPRSADMPLLTLETRGIRVTREQRSHGDSRRLGAFVRGIRWKDQEGSHRVDLSQEAALPIVPVNLSRDRFELPLNRSVVRFADAFIVHSRYVKERILRERGARTDIGILHHGSETRWRDEPRAQTRRRLGLSPAWEDSFVVTSFGGVQAHKRIDKALAALALARRERPNIRLILAGSIDKSDFDPHERVRSLGLQDAVHFTGFVPEEEGWDWLHAGDFSLNLRGPSSGGTSGGIFQAFSLARPVIASDGYEQAELPDSCVIKIPLGEGEVEALAQVLVELCDDPDRRGLLEEATKKFVREECHWPVVARQYFEYLSDFPKPLVTRRKLVRMKLGFPRDP